MRLRFHSEETFSLAAHILTEYSEELSLGLFELNFVELIMSFYSENSLFEAREELEIAQIFEDVDYRII